MVRRSDSTQTCGSDGASSCQLNDTTAKNATLPVILGVVIPVVCAIVVLIILHQRYLRRLRQEDAEDKTRSLDYGLGNVGTSGQQNMEEKSDQKGGKYVSLDMTNPNSPYLLPPGLTHSRESLHSLSRTFSDDNKYRPADSLFRSDAASLRTRGPVDDASSFTGSARLHTPPDDMNQGLLKNAQRISRSSPPLFKLADNEPESPQNAGSSRDPSQLNLPTAISPGLAVGDDSQNSHVSGSNSVATDFRRSNDYLSSSVHRDSPSPDASHSADPAHVEVVVSDYSNSSDFPLPPTSASHHDNLATAQVNLEPTQASSMHAPRISLPLSDGASDYGDGRNSTLNPVVKVDGVEDKSAASKETLGNPAVASRESVYSTTGGADARRMTFGLRPLPPEDPAEDPEQRANRIRSFYKEYFDQNRTENGEYHQEFGPEFYADSAVYDPVTGEPLGIPRPFAEPYARRAMTPPPRAPPRFQGAARHMATGSTGSGFDLPSPRVFSSASGRFPGPQAPRKPIPPPAPLKILPSPHSLKDDFYNQSIEYVRPGFDDRPDTAMSRRAATPILASPFEELSVLPSPHALRKSGAYTNLDFAPPPRFKTGDTSSDTGSIHSNRTGLSAAQLYNIRSGAYRVSRLPADTVGTKDDLLANLGRPDWNMGR
ncbi:hypothetical protein MPDQ_002890 [Monascus purpureus]|uniref:Uncharacterized protein n=1 Tax=Monascus purpureus TaxID=5098 RepID=A0A507QNZ3_MONPU|nr:hypothetical protein MPDQ_002890 [Monascus purpureus]